MHFLIRDACRCFPVSLAHISLFRLMLFKAGIEILELTHRSHNNMSAKCHYHDTAAEFAIKEGKANMQEIIEKLTPLMQTYLLVTMLYPLQKEKITDCINSVQNRTCEVLLRALRAAGWITTTDCSLSFQTVYFSS